MALYPSEATSLFSTDTFSSMTNRKPDKGVSFETNYNTVVFESENGYEKRRLRSRRPKRTYDLSYTNITGVEKYAIENFYKARSGDYESFTFDLAHINESGNLTVKFSSSLKTEQVLSAGSNLLQNYYTVSFTLKETFD